MADRVYTEGFPERWSMVHRDDCTLLVRRADMGFYIVPSQAVCMAPKLMQGEAWLETAKEIAHALAGSHKRELSRMFAEFCDSCGIGPPHDDKDRAMTNVRAVATWTCDRCGHVNVRPKSENPTPAPRDDSPPSRTLSTAKSDSAPEIAALRAENERLREALVDLVNAADDDFGVPGDHDEDDEPVGGGLKADGSPDPMAITFGHMRRARAALSEQEEAGE
jgi:hypothetical protein